ncbi:transcriptional regulator [Loktanella sp. TSTF-M6]|uniref:Transcriptional regulator n=1 Tax=Loktanella gaetbuli TaxID=2881335 RepID=A0ABS8BS50_9RHOB|nr:S24 family peptidase [Loktanella gaetbuli]MCB5198565.1 transcriptional regulator [Loktanella gaetbuli]
MELYLGPPRTFAQPESETLGDNDEEFVKVRRYDVKLSAGPGRSGDNSAPLSPVAFRTAWMTAAGLIADKCCVLGVQGDSMLPTLSDGDLVLVDERKTTLRDRSVYAFVDVTGDARIKRLERLDDQLLIRSDNPDHAIEIRKPAEANLIRLIGKVVWSGHSWR